VSDGEDLPDALDETLAEDGPALLHVAIDRDADCLPMFRPGGPAREMIG
jgi:acetolactate synthase-1/2/3 large subunit